MKVLFCHTCTVWKSKSSMDCKFWAVTTILFYVKWMWWMQRFSRGLLACQTSRGVLECFLPSFFQCIFSLLETRLGLPSGTFTSAFNFFEPHEQQRLGFKIWTLQLIEMVLSGNKISYVEFGFFSQTDSNGKFLNAHALSCQKHSKLWPSFWLIVVLQGWLLTCYLHNQQDVFFFTFLKSLTLFFICILQVCWNVKLQRVFELQKHYQLLWLVGLRFRV